MFDDIPGDLILVHDLSLERFRDLIGKPNGFYVESPV